MESMQHLRARGRVTVAPTAVGGHVAVSDNEAREIAAIIQRLEKQFPGVPPQHVVEVTLAALQEMEGRPVRIYVPVLVERGARERLRRLTATAPRVPASGRTKD